MGLFGPRKAELILQLRPDATLDAESLLVFLRGDQARSVLAAHGWEEQPQATSRRIAQGLREYVYETMMLPEATMRFSAVAGLHRASLTLRAPKEDLAEGAAALAEIKALAQEQYGPEVQVRLAGATARA